MNDVLMQQFIQLIYRNTGLHIREQDREALCKKIFARMNLLNLFVPEKYYQLLNNSNEQSNSSLETVGGEWRELTLLLTTGESYFFRDQGQITLLKNKILPELIEHKKKACYAKGEAKASLRIWSAGCSTGEEPYSLAILVKELIPDCDKWNILILGTDINPESIEKAKRGIYNSWSFRMVKPDLQRRYFYQKKTSWEIDEQIRKMVTFRSGNLMKDHFPNPTSDIHNIDIILCRNVFIYFHSQSISVVLEKFYNTLRPGGYLIAGHAELHGQNLGKLQTKVFPESVVYQSSEDLQVKTPLTARHSLPISYSLSPSHTLQERSDFTNEDTALKKSFPAGSGNTKGVAFTQGASYSQLSPVTAIPPTTIVSQIASSKTVTSGVQTIHSASPSISPLTKENLTEITSQTVLSQAETLFHNGAYAIAIKEAEQVIKQHPHHFGAYYLMAQALANLGECEKAIHYCHQALKVDSISVNPYYLLAHIAEEQGDVEKAKDLFKKIIYLAPSSISAYLELGSLYENEGNMTKARKMRNTAFELLKDLPPNVTVEQQGEMTAGELFFHVNKLLRNNTY